MFCFNTGLTDVAAHFPRTRDEIVTEQLDLLQSLIDKVLNFCKADEYGNGEADNGDEHPRKSNSPTLEARGFVYSLFKNIIRFKYIFS